MMYQAKRGGAPLVVIAGESGVRYDAMDAQMAADLVSMAKPVTKWATRVIDPSSTAARAAAGDQDRRDAADGPGVRRAADGRARRAHRRGGRADVVPVDTRVAPDADAVAQAAALLAGAERPIDHHRRRRRVLGRAGRADPGRRAARRRGLGRELLGGQHRRRRIRSSAASSGTCSATTAAAITSQADAVLIFGTYVFPEVFPALEGVFAPGAKVVHVDLDAYEIAKNFPVDVGLVADPKLTLGRARRRARAHADAGQRRRRAGARTDLAAAASASRARRRTRPRRATFDGDAAHALRACSWPSSRSRRRTTSMIFDEALTASPELTRTCRRRCPGHYFPTRGGSLGVGFPGAMGIKLAHAGQDRDRLQRRRRRDVHDPGAVDGGAPRHRRQVRRSATTAATSC